MSEQIVTTTYKDSDIERFLDKVILPADLMDKNACWVWIGGLHSKKRGYGKFWLNGRAIPAHTASYLLFRGPIETDKVRAHQCNVEGCVNPWHIEQETQKQNMDYKVACGRNRNQYS